MRINLVSTGDEVLSGEVQDTNATWASAVLTEQGFEVGRRFTCGDRLTELVEIIQAALADSRVVIVCGGLGPTLDDRTAEAVAEVAGQELRLDARLVEELKAKFAAFGIPYTDNQERQARLPRGAISLPNPRGTAPGIACPVDQGRIFCLPGPPREFQGMLEEQVLPQLNTLRAERAGEASVLAARVLKVFGRGEGWVADRLGDLEAEVPHLVLGYRAAMPEIHVKLRTVRPDAQQAQAVLDQAESLVRERLGDTIFGRGEKNLIETTVAALIERGLTLAAAESCTGGWIGKLITDVPGASQVFLLSAVTYANEAKLDLLGVDPAILAEHGAVSEPCARAMAEGARRISGADLALAVTGIAGPDGGSADKPVGTVFFGLASAAGTEVKRRSLPPMGRDRVRLFAAYGALDMIRKRLLDG